MRVLLDAHGLQTLLPSAWVGWLNWSSDICFTHIQVAELVGHNMPDLSSSNPAPVPNGFVPELSIHPDGTHKSGGDKSYRDVMSIHGDMVLSRVALPI